MNLDVIAVMNLDVIAGIIIREQRRLLRKASYLTGLNRMKSFVLLSV